ncbi:hypothetical protein [Thalassotalea sp. G2M2-11]|uniref:hypothetical protein n=1 Tax=Thalassotalea sp. G2M2-11 TaxID=2787627 RepID=UPI0019D21746|nr:hypothetical protein [Thalassotalea sp. G2M2-11]
MFDGFDMALRYLTLVFFSYLLSACQQQNHAMENKKGNAKINRTELSHSDAMNNKALQWQELTVRYIDLEGGFYGLVDTDGHRYLPLNLTKAYRQDGTIIKAKFERKPEVITIFQWGVPVSITEQVLIHQGKPATY